MKSRITLKDIATELGISTSTVSRALSGSHQISDQVRHRVNDLAKKLDYEPDRMASGLRLKKSMLIGVVVPSIAYNFNVRAIQGIEETLSNKGYKVLITQTMESYDREVENIKFLVSSKVDGIIVSLSAETRDFAHLDLVQKIGLPLVMMDRTTKYIRSSEVVVDNEEAIYCATKHLIEFGCKCIVWFQGPSNLPIADLRKRGYQKALEEYGLNYDPELIAFCKFNHDMGYSAMRDLLNKRPGIDGIVAINDRLAIGAMAAAYSLRRTIPEDVAIVGFNNEPFDELLNPSLSSIVQPSFEMGKEAGKLILSHLETGAFMPKRRLFKTHLIVRDSSRSK